MKKHAFVAAALAFAVGVALIPAVAPAMADAKTVYVQTSTESYSHDGSTWVKSWSYKSKYNKKGLVTSHTDKSYSEGKLTSSEKTKCTYDKKGRTKTRKTYVNGKVTLNEKHSYKGNKATIKRYEGKKYLGKTVTKASSKKSTSTIYNKKGKKTGYNVTTFDKKGNPKTYKSYESGKLMYKQKNTIKKGKITKSVFWNYENGKLSSKYTHKYKYSGSKITLKIYNGSGQLETVNKFVVEKKTGMQQLVSEKNYYEGKLQLTTTHKLKKYKSGKLKGIVKQDISYQDGKPSYKQVHAFKAIKVK